MNLSQHRNHRQQGVSLVGFVLLLALVGVFALLAMKLIPVYLDNYKLTAALHSMANEPESRNFSREEIINKLDKKLYIDFGDNVVDIKKTLVLKKTATTRTASIDYEVVVPLVYNLSALVNFENSVNLK